MSLVDEYELEIRELRETLQKTEGLLQIATDDAREAVAERKRLEADNARLRSALEIARDTLRKCGADPTWIDDALAEKEGGQ